jgi:hypothetical protein
MNTMKEKIVLTQTGDAPVKFSGKLITSVGGRFFRGKDVNRYYVLELYRADEGGKYVLSLSYQTQWEGESEWHDVFICQSESEVRQRLLKWNPIIEGIGYPPHPNYTEKQDRLHMSLRNQYDDLVTELLTEAGETFAISLEDRLSEQEGLGDDDHDHS